MPRNLNNITQTNGYTVQKPSIPLEWSSSYQAKTNQGTGNCGKIIPVFMRELMPNQTVNISQDVAIQFTPFISNLFHEIKGELITYFVPYRICAFMRTVESIDGETIEEADQLKWESFIDGGLNGNDNQKLPSVSLKQTKWALGLQNKSIKHTLTDYFGMPTHLSAGSSASDVEENPPNTLPWNAYNLIYNTKLRNPDFTEWKRMIDEGQYTHIIERNEVATAYWNADRFTRARKMQLRGIAPTIPVTNELIELAHNLTITQSNTGDFYGGAQDTITEVNTHNTRTDENIGTFGTEITTKEAGSGSTRTLELTNSYQLNDHTIQPGALGVEIDYNEFLYNLAILKYETNNARIKPRYTEFLKYRFGIIPQDSRFQEPEWIDSTSFNIGVDTVTATGSSEFTAEGESDPRTSTLGQITGQGWGGGQKMSYSFKAQEHGLLMTLMIIKPLSLYEGGLERFWWGNRTRFDFPTPELMNTPDNKIYRGELKFTGDEDEDKKLFGWQAIYDEYRTMTNQVCGLLRPSLDDGLRTYTLARFFNDQPSTINDDFLKCNPPMARIKQYQNQPDFIFFHRAEMKTAMPMPLINEPVNI